VAAADVHERPVELLQSLIRFDTTNPPGNEAACIAWAESLLREAGLETRVLARTDARPNLVARLHGRGDVPPLLLQGHVDVVSTNDQDWRVPPFEARIEDGHVWGRGSVDMKGGVAMMLAAVLRLVAHGEAPPGDVVLALTADEEAGGDYGARFLVERHADLFDGVRYALGEFGGYTTEFAGRRFYLIQVAEKQPCWMKASVRGPAGHGSIPIRGGVAAKIGDILTHLDRSRLPVHVTPVVRTMIETFAAALEPDQGDTLRLLLDPERTDATLEGLGSIGRILDPLLHNTVNTTIVRAGEKVNVVPAVGTVEIDGRLLPGLRPEDMIREIRALVGKEPQIEVALFDEGPADVDMGLYELLTDVLGEADATAEPVPVLLAGMTDGRLFSRLGIQTYGFLPMQLPPETNYVSLVHAANERVPLEAIPFGTDAIHQVLRRFHA
jgi:acetylornithine deacetylase/succinyl-diaminopimelate desuccinylase-like protein